ncbi:MAG: sensor domain-containing diguanylate cyclase [Burkholderiaceae bacterium]|nr:sensor domain-containing diguanylate cyclase [Burkholderiaceae bacterium]
MDSKLLSEVALAFVARDEFGTRLSNALRLLCTGLQLSRAYVYLDGQNESTMGYIHEWCADGIAHQWMQDVPYSSYAALSLELAQKGQIVAPDVSLLPDDLRMVFGPHGIQAVLAWPIEIDQEIIGFAGFDDSRRSRAWTSDEVALLRGASALISAFCEREILRDHFRSGKKGSGLDERSIRDPQTGIYNKHYVLNRLVGFDAEYARLGSNYCVSILEIDDFKALLENYGPAACDLVLGEFATIVSSAIRPYDIAGRYDGEEFIVVSVNAEVSEAVAMINRIRDVVEDHVIDFQGKQLRIAFSSGTADSSEFTSDDFSIGNMVETARRRLHQTEPQ